MPWKKAKRNRTGERSLQDVFDQWNQRPADLGMAGVPLWLARNQGPHSRPTFRTSLGHKFTPDCLWLGEYEALLIELKAADKYEPLAIAEVLHHHYMLADRRYVAEVPVGLRRDAIVPVIVGQYNPWTRAALAQLRARGWDAAALRYLEFEFISHDSQTVLWFDEPLAPWAPTEPPPHLPPRARDDYAHWYWVEDRRTWFGVTEPQGDRPVFILGPQINITEVVGAAGARLVAWESEPEGPGTYWMYTSV